MTGRNELSDILLDNESPTTNKSKKILIIAVAVILLFLAVLGIMAFINSDSKSQNNELDSRLALPPAPSETLQLPAPTTKPVEPKTDDQLFQQVPILPENRTQDDFEDMVKKLKDKENTRSNATEATQEKPKEPTKPAVTPESKPIVKPVEPEAKPEPKKTEPKPEPKKPDPKIEKKAEVKKPEPKPEPKPAAKPSTSSEAKAGTYVQVAAITKPTPDAGLMSKISAKGYSHTLLKVGNATKILIGPFNEAKAKEVLESVRKDIAPGAFLYRTK